MAISTGYRMGDRLSRRVLIDSSSSAIVEGDFLTVATAGYMKRAAAGDEPYCVAMGPCAVPSADGALGVLADFSEQSVYEVTATGVTAAMQWTTCDVGGAQAADVTASTDDSLFILDVDVAKGTAFVQIRPTFAGTV